MIFGFFNLDSARFDVVKYSPHALKDFPEQNPAAQASDSEHKP